MKTLATYYKVSAVCSHRRFTAEHFNQPLSREQTLPFPSYPQMQVSKLLPVYCFLSGHLT